MHILTPRYLTTLGYNGPTRSQTRVTMESSQGRRVSVLADQACAICLEVCIGGDCHPVMKKFPRPVVLPFFAPFLLFRHLFYWQYLYLQTNLQSEVVTTAGVQMPSSKRGKQKVSTRWFIANISHWIFCNNTCYKSC